MVSSGTRFKYYPLHTRPALLDVVVCNFPYEEAPDAPAKPRPVLVRSIALSEDGSTFSLEVAYGTSQRITDFPNHLVVSNMTEMNAAGLFKATRFNIDRTMLLPWAQEFFPIQTARGTPIIGHLHERTKEQLREITKKRV